MRECYIVIEWCRWYATSLYSMAEGLTRPGPFCEFGRPSTLSDSAHLTSRSLSPSAHRTQHTTHSHTLTTYNSQPFLAPLDQMDQFLDLSSLESTQQSLVAGEQDGTAGMSFSELFQQ